MISVRSYTNRKQQARDVVRDTSLPPLEEGFRRRASGITRGQSAPPEWTEQTVYQMLTKEHYTGEYTAYPGTEFETRCRCYAIVERDVFEGVQLILGDF